MVFCYLKFIVNADDKITITTIIVGAKKKKKQQRKKKTFKLF